MNTRRRACVQARVTERTHARVLKTRFPPHAASISMDAYQENTDRRENRGQSDKDTDKRA